MADRVQTTLITFRGGLATDLAPQVRESTFLTMADNAIYETSGAIRKVGGGTRVNVEAVSGSPSILGIYDYWRSGVTGVSTQKLVVIGGNGTVHEADQDGIFDNITGSATIFANAYPVFAQLADILTIWFSTANTPLKWDQTGNVASLGGTPPVARVATAHVNRMWAAGTNVNPSRLFFSAFGDPETWSGGDSGSIDIDVEDGDRIVGLASHKQRLLVFKGPNRGSIHEISGTAPTGSDGFARRVLVRGIALQTHNSIVDVGDDVWFMSERGVHSISATERFGNFEEADVTRFLKKFFRDQVNRTRLDRVWGVNYTHRSSALWTMAGSGQAEEGRALVLSYLNLASGGVQPTLWIRPCLSAAIRVNPDTRVREVVFGTADGFIVRQDVANRSIPVSTSYSLRVKTPQLLLGAMDSQGKVRADQPVTLYRMFMKSEPVGDYNVAVTLTRDFGSPTAAAPTGFVLDTDRLDTGQLGNLTTPPVEEVGGVEQYFFNQGSAGFILNIDQLDGKRLGGGNLQTRSVDLVGETRSISLDIVQGGLDQDANIFEVGVEWKPTAQVGATQLG